ncbi:MAG TPA: hypothetical protein VF380_06850 [Solirubrobacteraceae bacterium]
MTAASDRRGARAPGWILALALAACALAALTAGPAAASSRWRWSRPTTIRGLTDAVNGLACPSSSLCVAVSATDVFWSTRPLSGGSTWKKAALPPALDLEALQGQSYVADGITCTSTTFCVISDGAGNVYVSSNPTGGTAAWHESGVDFQTYEGLEAIACATQTLCAALDISGNAYTTSNPGGPWTYARISPTLQASAYSVSCAAGGSGLCAAVEADRRLAVTANPGGAPASWQVSTLSSTLHSVACPSVSLCVAGADGGRLFVSRSPTVAASWRAARLPGSYRYTQVSCHSGSLCLATDEFGFAALSTAPAASASAWHRQGRISTGSITALSCPSNRLCFVGTSTDEEIIGRG